MMKRWTGKVLAILVVLAMLPAGAVMENTAGEITGSEAGAIEAVLAGDDLLAPAPVEPEAGEVEGASIEAPEAEPEGAEEDVPVEPEAAPDEDEAGIGYARALAEAAVYADAECTQPQGALCERDVVLLLEKGASARIAYVAGTDIEIGFVDAAALSEMTAEEADAYIADVAESGEFVLYGEGGDAVYPLARAASSPAEEETEAPAEEETEAPAEEEAEAPAEEDTEAPAEEEAEAPAEEEAEAPAEEEAEAPAEEEAEAPAEEEAEAPAEEEETEAPAEEEETEAPAEEEAEAPAEEETEAPAEEEETEAPAEEEEAEAPAEEETVATIGEEAEAPAEEETEATIGEEIESEPVETAVEAELLPEDEEAPVVEHGTAMSNAANVYYADFKKDKITAGSSCQIVAITDASAKYLYAYNASGKKVKSWGVSNSELSGEMRTWQVSSGKFSSSGTAKWSFGASSGNGKIGTKKTDTLIIVPAIKSAALGASTATAGSKGSITVKTDTGAKYLYAYNASGTKIGTWSASKYSSVSNGVRTWKVIRSYPTSGNVKFTIGASAGNGHLSAKKTLTMKVISVIKSAALGASTATAGSKGSITVKTDTGAKYLYAYNASGTKIGTWSASKYSSVSNGVRTWKVIRSYPTSGNVKFTVGASAGNGHLSAKKTLTMKVIPVIKSAALGASTARAGSKGSITVKTDTGAKYLYAYNASGTKIGTWSASKYSSVSNGVRTWKVIRSYPTSGNVKFTIGASAGNGHLSAKKTLTMKVISVIKSAALGASTVQAGKKGSITVKTDTGAKYLYAYNASGTKIGTWSASKYSSVSNGVRTWKVVRSYPTAGTVKFTVGASAGNGHLSAKKTLTMYVLPLVKSITPSQTSFARNSTISIKVTTNSNTKYLYGYDASGTKTGTWSAGSYSTISNGLRVWTVNKTFPTAGTIKFGFATTTGNGHLGPKKYTTVTVTSGSETSSVKYRALLIGEVMFNPVCYRNLGDTNLMESMLNSIKGPAGNRYQITKMRDLSKSEILSAISSTFAGATDEDVSLFFIATHGAVKVGSSYLDVDYYPEYAGALSVIPASQYLEDDLTMGELANALKAIPGKVIVLVESCGSGSGVYSQYDTENSRNSAGAACAAFDAAVIKAFADTDPGLLVDDEGKVYANDGTVSKVGELRVENKFYVLTASRHKEYSVGSEYSGDTTGSYSFNYFTKWLVEGVGTSGHMPADTDYNDTTTLNELFNYISSVGDNYQFSDGSYQHVQVYPKNSSYGLFKR